MSCNIEGDAYWWDPGPNTDDVLYDFAVAGLVKAAGDGPDKFRLCGFRMMQGNGNTARNSVAVGVQGSTTSSGFHWPEEGDPHGEWTFQGNVSHNNALHGAFNWQNDSRKHDIKDSVFYYNGEYGIDHGAYLNTYLFKGVTLCSNGEAGLNLRAGSRGGRGLRFDDLLLDGVGISEHAILADDHTPPSEGKATRFSRTELRMAEGGTLTFAEDKSASLELRGNLVVEGALRMVAPNPAVQETIRFVGVDEDAFRGGGHEVLASDVGLWAHHHGRLDIQGAAKTSWTHTRGARAGERRLALEAPPVGWRAATTWWWCPPCPDQRSLRRRLRPGQAAVGGRGQGCPGPVAHLRPPLGRRLQPRGAQPDPQRPHRRHPRRPRPPHVDGRAQAGRQLRPAPLRGVSGAQGRYGLHFHEAGDASRDTLVVGTVVRDADNHAFVGHASQGVQFKQTIGYDTEGDAYWWDPPRGRLRVCSSPVPHQPAMNAGRSEHQTLDLPVACAGQSAFYEPIRTSVVGRVYRFSRA